MVQHLRIPKGLDIPVAGAPEQSVHPGPAVRSVALLGDDSVGLRPALAVTPGDRVKLGQLLFTDRKNPGVRYTSPAAGRVAAVHRGAKRALDSVVVDVDGDEEAESFPELPDRGVEHLDARTVRDALVASGLWTALRTRPFGKVPPPESTPQALCITALDTQPLAPRPELAILPRASEFQAGVLALSKLAAGRTYVCRAAGSPVSVSESDRVRLVEVSGPHPAGLAGTLIHWLEPAGKDHVVWYAGYQEVIAAGRLFTTGRLSTERIVSIAGPAVGRPRVVRTRIGASIADLTRGELGDGEIRVISGSVLSGRHAWGPRAYLGRYHQQVSALPEGRQRVFLGWLAPGWEKLSVKNVVLSRLRPRRPLRLTTSLEGSRRAMVPLGTYEKVLPFATEPVFLLRALIVGDADEAEELGCLELEEEDLALCTLVCPGKYDYGPLLRTVLERIEREG